MFVSIEVPTGVCGLCYTLLSNTAVDCTEQLHTSRVAASHVASFRLAAALIYTRCDHFAIPTKCLQAAAFDSWVQAVHTSCHSRQVLSKALRRITNLKLSQAFGWWRDQAQALHAAHAKAGQIVLRMQHQSLACAFYSWSDAVLRSQQAAAQREQLVDAAAAKNKLRLVVEIFEVRHTSNCCKRT